MSKRAADELNGAPLKAGQRPENGAQNEEGLDFEDDFEDEFESEDEIMEAGVDGRPDAEREAEASKGERLCHEGRPAMSADREQTRWTSTPKNRHSFLADRYYSLARH